MCLGKTMGLGLVYGLSSAFLGSKAALALRWIKNRPGLWEPHMARQRDMRHRKERTQNSEKIVR